MDKIAGKVVVLTGASRGLGVDMAIELAKRKARLVLASRSLSDLEQTQKKLDAYGVESVVVPTDVSGLESLRALIEQTKESFGDVDILINNAGVEKVCNFEAMDADEIEWIIKVNLVGTAWLTREVVPKMIERRSGHIVNISSMAGMLPVPHNSVYSATKHGLVGLSRSLRIELAPFGIGVSVVCPGFVDGGMFLEWGRRPPKSAGWVTSQKVADEVVRSIDDNVGEIKVIPPLGKMGPTLWSISPGLTLKTMESTGVIKYLDEQATINASRND